MTVFVALLAGVNVGGNRKAPAAALKQMCQGLGWKRAETLLASGNIILDSGREGAAKVAQKLEAAITDAFGFDTTVIVRTADQLDDVIARQPYKEFQPNLLLVNFLAGAPTKAGIAALDAFNKLGEDYVVDGAEMFIRYDSGVAQTKLTPPVIKRTLGFAGTARNWNTLHKLRDRARVMEAGRA